MMENRAYHLTNERQQFFPNSTPTGWGWGKDGRTPNERWKKNY